MENLISDWAYWKRLCITVKNLTIQYVDKGDAYLIIGPDSNGINWLITLPKLLDDGSPNPDADDFVANVLPACNFAIGQRAYPFSSPDMQFAGSGFAAVFGRAPQQPQTTDFLFPLPNVFYLNGGEYWTVGATAGDTLQVDLVDHDNVLGFGKDFVLVKPSYLSAWNIVPLDNAHMLFQTVYAAKPPAGVYLRFRYTATGLTQDVKMYCNLFLHKPL